MFEEFLVTKDGKTTIDEAALTALLDRERNKASETARSNTEKNLRASIEKELRGKIEQEATLTAEQKALAALEEREKIIAEREKKFENDNLRSIYKNSNLFSDEEIEVYMSIGGENYDDRCSKAQKLVASRTKYNKDYETTYAQKMQGLQPRTDEGANGQGGISSIANKAKSYNNNGAVELDLSKYK